LRSNYSRNRPRSAACSRMLFASAASVSRDAIFDGRIIRSATLMQSGKQKDAAANSDGHVQGDTAQQKNRHLLSPVPFSYDYQLFPKRSVPKGTQR
jgi:hypothetical protein